MAANSENKVNDGLKVNRTDKINEWRHLGMFPNQKFTSGSIDRSINDLY